jgi:hypothetical protein
MKRHARTLILVLSAVGVAASVAVGGAIWSALVLLLGLFGMRAAAAGLPAPRTVAVNRRDASLSRRGAI